MKTWLRVWTSRILPQGLKPWTFLKPRSARLKSCPDTKQLQILAGMGLFASCILSAGMPLLQAQDGPASAAPTLQSQGADAAAGPIAIVPIDAKNADAAATVTGALEVSRGRAVIAASGTVTSGSATTQVILPRRGMLRVCAATTVKLAADAGVAAGELPGLLIAMDHGAVEMSFATTEAPVKNADVLMTPEFRILIDGPGAAEVKVRLGEHGDTCVDNAGANAPYVLVSSVFDGGAYRVQPGQRVMFQNGSLHEVVDQEKEPCGCPPDSPKGNEFPLAASEGLTAKPAPVVSAGPTGGQSGTTGTLAVNRADRAATPAEGAAPPAAPDAGTTPNPAAASPEIKKKPGFFAGIGHFFKRIFGAE
jgi:hypothetical protein